MISKDHSDLSIVKRSKLLQLHRSGFYYRPEGESELNLELMRLMDEHNSDHYFKGAKRMHNWLTMDKGYKTNHKRVRRLPGKMGHRTLYPKKYLSQSGLTEY